MSPAVFLLGALGGGLGAALRFVVDGVLSRRLGTGFPWGIFVINASGSLLLGLLTGLAGSSAAAPGWAFVALVGVTGGYTTFSTATIDTIRLIRERRLGSALTNSLGMLGLAVGLAFAGLLLGRAL